MRIDLSYFRASVCQKSVFHLLLQPSYVAISSMLQFAVAQIVKLCWEFPNQIEVENLIFMREFLQFPHLLRTAISRTHGEKRALLARLSFFLLRTFTLTIEKVGVAIFKKVTYGTCSTKNYRNTNTA